MSSPARKNLVMGLIQGYTWEQLAPFVQSLRETAYSGDIVFFYRDIPESTLVKLREAGVEVIPFKTLRGVRPGKLVAKALDALAAAYYRVKAPFFPRLWHVLLSPSEIRYKLYREYLAARPGVYDKVLFTDTRDVYFQRDPFAEMPAAEAIFFQEDPRMRLKDSKYNSAWLLAQFPPEVLERLGDKLIICSGTSMGSAEGLMKYLDIMLDTMKTARRLNARYCDQAIHNVVVYEKMGHLDTVRISANTAGPIYTLASWIPAQELQLSGQDELLYPDGRVAPILHQYDRHPHILKPLLDKLGLAAPAK